MHPGLPHSCARPQVLPSHDIDIPLCGSRVCVCLCHLVSQRSFSDLRLRSGGGVVDLATVEAVFGWFLPPALLGRLFASWDRTGSGAADVNELTACVSVCCMGSIEERIEYAFKLFDSGKTGRLTAAQVADMVGIVWWTSQRAGDAECGYNATALEALVGALAWYPHPHTRTHTSYH